jgi:RNA polymerase sigma-70 factor (ECF subfamily)
METSQSLLERLRTAPDEAAWERFDKLYRPLLLHWLRRYPRLRDEAEDIVQEVMDVLTREIAGFQPQQQGSFRRWLSSILTYRALAHHRARQHRPQALGAPLEECPLAQLADPGSELSRLWDQEHDQYVLHRLLKLVEPQFEPATFAAFCRVAFDGAEPAQVAEELGISVAAVYLAKSHVLKRLRQEAQGLIA